MKILFTQDALINAGSEKSHLEIISRFSDKTEASMVYFYPRHDLKEVYLKAGISLYFLDVPESYNFSLAVTRLVRLIRKEKPDLLISCLWRADIITRISSILTGVPLVGTLVNDSYSHLAWHDKTGIKYKVVYWLDRLTAGIPIHWIANSYALADSHAKFLGLKKEKISVVYRGREIPDIPQRQPRSIRRFVSYGRLLERKGFQDAILAFCQVLGQYSDCSFTIFGEGPFRSNLESLIDQLDLKDKVFLPGKFSPHLSQTSDRLGIDHPILQPPYSLLQNFDCFLFPSWYEGFSGALVEALISSIPIIASDIPMNLEAVEDKKSAFVFPVRDIEQLAKTMLYTIEHQKEAWDLGKIGRGIATDRFDVTLISSQYEANLLRLKPE